MSFNRLLLLFGIGSLAFPSWDQKNEAVQSDSRPNRRNGRYESSKRTHLIHRPAKDIVPPVSGISKLYFIGCDAKSDGHYLIFPCPLEFGAVTPHSMHDHR
jgi:hypothetical protein